MAAFPKTIFMLLFFMSFTAMVSYSKLPDISYSKHCASLVPESTLRDHESTTNVPFPPNQDGLYLGGDGILNLPNSSHRYPTDRKTLLFQTHHVYNTDADSIYKVFASLIIEPSGVTYVHSLSYSYSYSPEVVFAGSRWGSLSFEVEGFWSESSGNLCMVGSSSSSVIRDGNTRVLDAVLKLYGVRSSNDITSLVRGTLDSLSSVNGSSYFKPISLLMFPKKDYMYKVSKGPDYGCKGGIDVPKEMSLSLPMSKSVCSIFSQFPSFELENESGCNTTGHCAPFGKGAGFLPQLMSLSLVQCLDDRQSLRFLAEFPNSDYIRYDRPFNPDITLIAEGSWDTKTNQLCVIACRILDGTKSLNGSHIEEDCSIRLSLRFPSVWSIRTTHAIVGEVWSTKDAHDPGYFKMTAIQSQGSYVDGISGLKYNYTMIEKARKYCTKKPGKNKKGQYPDGNSRDMRFDMSVRNSSEKRIGYGYSDPIFVGDRVAQWTQGILVEAKSGNNINSQLNISYRISLPSFYASSNESRGIEIVAEGIYDSETGDLCMVGCRNLNRDDKISANAAMDCDVLVTLKFPPVSSNQYIRGTIESTREESSLLYFKPLSFSAVSSYRRYARDSIWRMDFEIIVTLISNTLVCIFAACQIWYVRKHPDVSHFISLLMLMVLALGHMIPLVLNFEAVFFTNQNDRSFPHRTGGRIETNEVLVRVLAMASFLLQFRLLQMMWTARLANGNPKASWATEKKTLYVCLPLYIAGGLVALSFNWRNYETDPVRINSHQNSLWADLRSYAGLMLDGFLLPQILMNIFNNSRQTALSRIFYLGITFARVMPHAYDLYRAYFYDLELDWSYMYANRSADYYSTTWDVIIPLGGLLFAATIYLQQRFGGRCFLPERFKEVEEYEKVAAMSEA